MKVKEIIDILNFNGKKVSSDELIGLLDNIGVEADNETDIEAGVVKKLSKKYGVDIKPVKVKKEAVKPIVKKEEPKQQVKEVKQEVKASKEVKKEPVKIEEPKQKEKTKEISYHKSWERPNGGYLDLGWRAEKISAFLRAMDYSILILDYQF